jgi:hypothetical protein
MPSPELSITPQETSPQEQSIDSLELELKKTFEAFRDLAQLLNSDECWRSFLDELVEMSRVFNLLQKYMYLEAGPTRSQSITQEEVIQTMLTWTEDRADIKAKEIALQEEDESIDNLVEVRNKIFRKVGRFIKVRVDDERKEVIRVTKFEIGGMERVNEVMTTLGIFKYGVTINDYIADERYWSKDITPVLKNNQSNSKIVHAIDDHISVELSRYNNAWSFAVYADVETYQNLIKLALAQKENFAQLRSQPWLEDETPA